MSVDSQLSGKLAALAPEQDDVAAALLRAAVRSRLADADPIVRLGRYEVGRRLGGGGMGVVYEGLDPELDRRVAIKVLHERSDDADAVLQREARLLAAFSHEHCVTVFDIGTDDASGRVWVAMELVDGVHMRRWLQERNPPRAKIVAVFAAAASALAAMHRAGLSHGDFKPENVLVGASVVKVADFGLARLVGGLATGSADPAPRSGDDANVDPSGGGTVGGGTPGYIAPERLDGGKATPQADQFAFCVALFEALHGQLPYGDNTLARQGTRSTPATRDRLDGVLQRGLHPDPARRFATMDALAAAMRRTTTGTHALPWIAAGAIAFVGASWAWASRDPSPPAPEAAALVAAAPKIDLAPLDALAKPIQDHINAARYDEATAALPALFAMAETLESDQARAIALRIRGTIEQRTGAYESAIQDFQRARDVAWSANEASLATAAAISLAHLYSEQLGDDERAGRELDMAEAILRRRGIDPDDNIAFVRARGTTTLRGGDRAAALRQFERVVALLDADTAPPLERAAALFYVAEAGWAIEPERARKAAEEALPLMRQTLGPDHPFVAGVQSVLGKLADADGRWAAAQQAYGDALRIYEAADNEPLMIANMHYLLGQTLRQAGEREAARSHLDRAKAVLDEAGGDENALHAALQDALGSLAYDAGDAKEAARHFRNAARIFEATAGPDHHDMIPTLVHLARVGIDEGDFAAALENAEHALRIIGDSPHGSKADALAAAAEARVGPALRPDTP